MEEKIMKKIQKQREKLMNKETKTIEEFIEIQNELCELEFKMMELNDNHIPHID